MKLLNETVGKIKKIDHSLKDKTQKRLDNLTKPQGSLGRLEDLSMQMVEITGKDNPPVKNKVIFTMAGDHGVVEEGVSAFPQEVTSQMVYNFLRGGAGINVLARHIGSKVIVVDMGVAMDLNVDPRLIIKKVNYGTKNITKGPAMTKEEAVLSIERGIEVFDNEYKNGIDIVGTGEMGIGNTTSSSAITSTITGRGVEEVTGRGTGIDDAVLTHKIDIIKKSITINNPNKNDAIDVLAKIGGFEIGGLVGVILAAASRRVPIVIDGFISGAAALVAYQLESKIKDYLIAAHASVEQGHAIIFNHIGLEPVLNLNLRLGEGTGAALAMNTIEAGIKILNEMATFEHAAVAEKKA